MEEVEGGSEASGRWSYWERLKKCPYKNKPPSGLFVTKKEVNQRRRQNHQDTECLCFWGTATIISRWLLGDKQQHLSWNWLRAFLTTCLFVSALTELGDMEGYGHVYIGPFNPALCHAATLFTEHWEAGLAAPGCLAPDWPSLPPITPPTKVLFTVLRFFRWAHVAVISGVVRGGEGGSGRECGNVWHHKEITPNW